jgi:hypothetical protein
MDSLWSLFRGMSLVRKPCSFCALAITKMIENVPITWYCDASGSLHIYFYINYPSCEMLLYFKHPFGLKHSFLSPSHRGFTITLTPGRTPLDEWSARRRDPYLTTHKTHKSQTSMPPAGSNPQSQESSGRRPTPLTARPVRSAQAARHWILRCVVPLS